MAEISLGSSLMAGKTKRERRMLQRYVVRLEDGSTWIKILSNFMRDNERGMDTEIYCVIGNCSH
jgi:hypothetical protein